jgi:hypothetical protein
MIDPADVSDLQLEDVEDYTADYPPPGFPNAEDNIHTAGSGDESATGRVSYRRSKFMGLIRGNKWVSGLLFVMVVVLIAIIGAAVSGGSKAPSSGSSNLADSGATHQAPITIDPESLDPDITGPLMDSLVSAYERHGLDATPLGVDAGETPQRKAFYWMATDENLDDMDHTQKMQRYALAVFYYSTNSVKTPYTESPKPWESAHLWLSKAHTCEWKGIVCNSQQHVEGIDLENNNLTGSLAPELGILGSKLTSIDLTSNLIYMKNEDFDAFEKLENLETLLMDDNYLEYTKGLPWQFQKLTKMQKMRLSYNLFSGELETEHKVISKMSQLTHLEIESNFLTGKMPDIVGEMSNLVYIYLRRNEMTFNLDFLKKGQLTNLCKLRLRAVSEELFVANIHGLTL